MNHIFFKVIALPYSLKEDIADIQQYEPRKLYCKRHRKLKYNDLNHTTKDAIKVDNVCPTFPVNWLPGIFNS